jgi:transcriptional regulator with XRE-family HTH domain
MITPSKRSDSSPKVSHSKLSTFGAELRSLRIQNGMRLYDLAARLGVSPSYVSSMETGRINISDGRIDQIGIIFNLSEYRISALREAAQNSKSRIAIVPNSADAKILANLLRQKINLLSKSKINNLIDELKKASTSEENEPPTLKCQLSKGCRLDFKVARATRSDIAPRAVSLRHILKLDDKEPFYVDDQVLQELFPELVIIVTEDKNMDADTAGKASFTPPFIEISESVYEEIIGRVSRGTWVFAHELGHIFLTHEQGMRGPMEIITAADLKKRRVKKTESAEWQADEFAAELLMPSAECRGASPELIQDTYRVSERVAKNRAKYLRPRRYKGG